MITIRLTKVSEERISAEAKDKAVIRSDTGNKDGLIRTIKKPLRQSVAFKTAKRGEQMPKGYCSPRKGGVYNVARVQQKARRIVLRGHLG